jgi:hypothetical protein
MKKKYAKIPKKYIVSKENPTVFRVAGLSYRGLLFDRFWYPKWLLRPICWFKGHKNRILYPFGIKIKQCQRCAKEIYKKQTNEKPQIFSGEVGQLYGVRFLISKKSKLTKYDKISSRI